MKILNFNKVFNEQRFSAFAETCKTFLFLVLPLQNKSPRKREESPVFQPFPVMMRWHFICQTSSLISIDSGWFMPNKLIQGSIPRICAQRTRNAVYHKTEGGWGSEEEVRQSIYLILNDRYTCTKALKKVNSFPFIWFSRWCSGSSLHLALAKKAFFLQHH